MEKVVVAFESAKSGERIREILESSGTAGCVVCRSADQVRRLVHKQHIGAVVCGYKLSDDVSENLFHDLPDYCSMLLIASQEQLDMLGTEDIFKLAAPVSRGDLTASVRMLIQFSHRLEKFIRPQRSVEERAVIESAKELLMARNGMTEEEAHRFLQKRSMDTGAKMVQTAQLVLREQ